MHRRETPRASSPHLPPFLLQRLGFVLGYPVHSIRDESEFDSEHGIYIPLPSALAGSGVKGLCLPAGAINDPFANHLLHKFLRYSRQTIATLKTAQCIETTLIRQEQFLWDNLVFSEFYGSREKYAALTLLTAARESATFRFEGISKALGIICAKQPYELIERTKSLGATALEITSDFDLLWSLRSRKLAHLLSDGVQTFFIVDLAGRTVAWLSLPDSVLETKPPVGGTDWELVPADFGHLRRVLGHGETCFITTPLQEVYVLNNAHVFKWSARVWRRVSGRPISAFLRKYTSPEVSAKIVALAMLMSKRRTGALIVLTDRPETVLPASCTPVDRLFGRQPLFPIIQANIETLMSFASLDGALLIDTAGQVITAGVILELPKQYTSSGEGARMAAATFSSTTGVSILISKDGPVSVYDSGRIELSLG